MVENETPISVSTISASGQFPAPWVERGSVTRNEENGVDFDLEFMFGVSARGAPAGELNLIGSWNLVSSPPQVSEEMSLEGWSLYTIGPIQREVEGSEVFDYGAVSLDGGYLTVGDLRRDLADK